MAVEGAFQNPQLEIYRGEELVAANDNWRDAPNQQEIIDSTVAPANELESAVLTALEPGAYTAIVSGVEGETGVGSGEAYDPDPAADSSFANISTRGFVQTGADAMFGGLIITGSSPQTIILRAIGPSLGIAAHGMITFSPVCRFHVRRDHHEQITIETGGPLPITDEPRL